MVLATELFGLLLEIEWLHPVLAYVTIVAFSLYLILTLSWASFMYLILFDVTQSIICDTQTQAFFVAS